jgi:uncharacterized membrane protein YvlD (DUF360 family)
MRMSAVPPPSGARVSAAFLAGAVASVAALCLHMLWQSPVEAAFSLVVLTLLFGLPIALLHAFVLGLPAYLVLRRFRALGWWSAALGGFVVGAAPIALLTLRPIYDFEYGADVLVIHGHYTAAGWRSYAVAAATGGVYGAVGGLACWLVIRRARDPAARPGSCR